MTGPEKMESNAVKGETNYVRLRGLPFSAKESHVRDFLSGVNVLTVNMPPLKDGRSSGDAYCGLKTLDDVAAALKLHRNNMESRYIEVFELSAEELNGALRRGLVSEEGRLVKLRGLPFSATENDIKDFLKGLDCEDVLITKAGGRPSGEAFVRLGSRSQATSALERNKMHMGQRYVEVYVVPNAEEVHRARGYLPMMPMMGGGGPNGGGPRPLRDIPFGYMPQGGPPPPPMPPSGFRPGPPGPYPPAHPGYPRDAGGYDGGRPMRPMPPGAGAYRSAPYDLPRPLAGGPDDYVSPTKVFMRGLPFDVTADQIERFFSPLRCMEIKVALNDDRRPSGDGSVEFQTIAEAREALHRNKNTIGKRYIELYPANQMPPQMRRVHFRLIGGAPMPPVAPLSAPNNGAGPRGYPPAYANGGPYDYDRNGAHPPHGPAGYGAGPGGHHGGPGGGRGDYPPGGGRGGGGDAPYGSFPSRYDGGGGGGGRPAPAPVPPPVPSGHPHHHPGGRGGGYEDARQGYQKGGAAAGAYDGYGAAGVYDRAPVHGNAGGGGGGGYPPYDYNNKGGGQAAGDYYDNAQYQANRKSWLY